MKKKNIITLLASIFAGFMLTNSVTIAQQVQGKTTEIHKQGAAYTCPMHPEVTRNEPGKCPKCGMDLVMKKDKQKKMIHIQSDTVKMKHGHSMHDSTKMYHQKMMNDSSKMIHHHKHDPSGKMYQKTMKDSSKMKHHHEMK